MKTAGGRARWVSTMKASKIKTLIFLNSPTWENNIEFHLENENADDLNALRMA